MPESKTSVLIIDDEPETVSMLTAFLNLFEFEARAAYSGEAGLGEIAARQPAVLILDIMMPDIDGLEICRRLRDDPNTRDIPVMMLSARTTPDDVKIGYAAGATRYIKKPVDLDMLLAEVRKVAALVHHRLPSEAEQQADADRPPTG